MKMWKILPQLVVPVSCRSSERYGDVIFDIGYRFLIDKGFVIVRVQLHFRERIRLALTLGSL